MSELRTIRESALARVLLPGRYGAEGAAGLLIRELAIPSLQQITAWSDSLEAVRELAWRAAGITSPIPRRSAGGRALCGSAGSLLQIEPLKWWLLGGAVCELAVEQGHTLDLSHSRCCLHLCGEQAATVLNRHLALDLRDGYCPVNAVASTAFEHVGVTLWRRAEGFDLFLPRSYAASLFTLLCQSAEQFGYHLEKEGASS